MMKKKYIKLNMLLTGFIFLISMIFSLADEELTNKKLKWIVSENDERTLCEVYKITKPNGNLVEAYYKIGEKKPSWHKTIYDHKKETLDKCPAQAKEGWFFILDKQYVTYRKGVLTDKEKKRGLRAFKSKAKAMFESVLVSLEKTEK